MTKDDALREAVIVLELAANFLRKNDLPAYAAHLVDTAAACRAVLSPAAAAALNHTYLDQVPA